MNFPTSRAEAFDAYEHVINPAFLDAPQIEPIPRHSPRNAYERNRRTNDDARERTRLNRQALGHFNAVPLCEIAEPLQSPDGKRMVLGEASSEAIIQPSPEI
jgi:hypothetical protein